MNRNPTRDLVVGIFVLLGIGAIVYLSVHIGGFSWRTKGGLKLTADFNETGDLAVRAPVVIAGVRVGEVTALKLNDRFRATVEMDLQPDLKLPTDTSAAIVTAGMLGDRYIELQPGGDDQLLKTGDKIGFTESAVILERVLGQIVYGITNGNKQDAANPTTANPTTAKTSATRNK